MISKINSLTSIIILSIFLMDGVLAISGDYLSNSSSLSSNDTKIDNSNFLGIPKSKTTKILDNFKEKQQILVFDNVPISVEDEAGLFDSESKTNSLEQILKRLENTKTQYKEKKRSITKEKISLKNTLKQIDEDIDVTSKYIKDTTDMISDKNIKINEYANKINELEVKITLNRESIYNYLKYIYSKGDLIYSENNNDIDLIRSIILNDGNLSDIINDIHFKTIVELSGQNLIEIHRSLIKENYFNKEALKKEKIESLRLKKSLEIKNKDLIAQKEYKENLLEITKGQEALFNRYILAKQEKQDDIQNKINDMNNQYDLIFNEIGDKYNCNFNFLSGSLNYGDIVNNSPVFLKDDTPKCREIKKYFILEKKLRDENNELPEQNPFLWPVEPEKTLSTYFHDEDYFTQLGSEHEAIDIPVMQGTDIIAPAAGYVYFVFPPEPGGYGYIALKHASGFVTVYGHISDVYVRQFDFVESGEIFAKSGGAPGTPGAGPMTSGPHLHFELYKDRVPVDPLRFLDLTHLNFEDLNIKYRYKYIEDLKIRYGNKANISKFKRFYISGDNEVERQKYLLNRYATLDFNDWNIWVEEGMNGKIDPSFLMCLGLAETGLGRHLKTSYNVGNVGNTDSGSTYQFIDSREGIYWIVKTLNNKFLGEYNTIDKLSRWGNEDGSIYASSDTNWHNNIVKCLSSLKGRFVEDDYKFRIIE